MTRLEFAAAFTLVEVMVAMVVPAIAALGTLGYQRPFRREGQDLGIEYGGKMVTASAKRLKSVTGFTLIEVMVATVILLVVVLGNSGYRYYAALDARKAAMRNNAAGIALLLCENWRGVQGTNTYDPTAYFTSDLSITAITLPSELVYEGFTPLGAYKVVSNGVNYYPVLLWKDVSTGFRALNIVVYWSQSGQATTGIADADKPFKLTAYTTY